MYTGIDNTNCTATINAKVVRKRQLHILSCAFVCVLVFACLNISLLSSLGISNFVRNITSRWTPKTEDIGKIKFVNFSFNNPESPNGVFIVSSPFKNYYVTNVDETCLQVNGLGDMIVCSPIAGKVQDVQCHQGVYNLTIAYGNVCVILGGLNFVTTSVGATVSEGDKIGVDTDSLITFKILCDGKYIPLHASGAADTFFE